MAGTTGRAIIRPPDRKRILMPRLALFALVVCVLALAAAVLSFAHGSIVLGVVWLMMTGVSSNIAWFHIRKARAQRAARQEPATR